MDQLTPVTADLSPLRSAVTERMAVLHARVGAARRLAEQGQVLEKRASELGIRRETAERVGGLLAKIADDRDEMARSQVEGLVTAGLQAIFGSAEGTLSFHLVQSTLRNTSNIDFTVRTTLASGESFDTDVLSARGGGLASVVGMLLRVVLILLTRQTGQPVSDVLVLDESLSMLSADRQEAAAAFLRTLVDSTNLQVIMVTHSEILSEPADVVYRLRLDGSGMSQVTKER